jgi:hypothetical protein
MCYSIKLRAVRFPLGANIIFISFGCVHMHYRKWQLMLLDWKWGWRGVLLNLGGSQFGSFFQPSQELLVCGDRVFAFVLEGGGDGVDYALTLRQMRFEEHLTVRVKQRARF